LKLVYYLSSRVLRASNGLDEEAGIISDARTVSKYHPATGRGGPRGSG